MAVRKVLWRAYDVASKRWLNYNDMINRGILLSPRGEWLNAQNIVPMQYTGIIDIEKKGVFEADIVEIDMPNEWGSITKDKGIVGWSDPVGGFVAMKTFEEGQPPMICPLVNVRVVGNTIDNPDMIPKPPASMIIKNNE